MKSALVAGWTFPIQGTPSDGDQFELGLFAEEPWEGRSPRVLTRGHLGLIFKPQGGEALADRIDPCQVEMFPRLERRRERTRRNVAPCAPTLLPLPSPKD